MLDPALPGTSAAPRYKQLLYINEYPPNTAAGAPVIARQLFRHYPQDRIEVLCCGSWYDNASPTIRDSFLPCRHVSVRSHRTRLRPRRIFAPIESSLDCRRLPKIMAIARRMIEERGVEALFTMSYGAEMPHAAFFLAKEYGLPLYYFESDRLDSVFTCRCAKKLITEHRLEFLHGVKKLWLTSPKMVREFKELYGVDGEYLFHFVDVDGYQRMVAESPAPPAGSIQLIYTGSINVMFYDTMKWFCQLLNRGLAVDGRQVELTVHGTVCPPAFLGPHVRFGGLVSIDEIPKKLAQAHLAVILVSFTQDPSTLHQIRTSLYTKTVDYLAAGRPVLIVSPDYSAEVDCFGGVAAVVDGLDERRIVETLRRLSDDHAYAEKLRNAGLAMVRDRHSLEALDRLFLAHFRVPS